MKIHVAHLETFHETSTQYSTIRLPPPPAPVSGANGSARAPQVEDLNGLFRFAKFLFQFHHPFEKFGQMQIGISPG
jgi:hypothetical protein